jgi:hypothetical protein
LAPISNIGCSVMHSHFVQVGPRKYFPIWGGGVPYINVGIVKKLHSGILYISSGVLE